MNRDLKELELAGLIWAQLHDPFKPVTDHLGYERVSADSPTAPSLPRWLWADVTWRGVRIKAHTSTLEDIKCYSYTHMSIVFFLCVISSRIQTVCKYLILKGIRDVSGRLHRVDSIEFLVLKIDPAFRPPPVPVQNYPVYTQRKIASQIK